MINKNYAYLLNRPEHKFDEPAIDAMLTGKTILVTGAGGSIGSALVRRIARAHANTIYVLGHGEDSIFQLTQQLKEDGDCNATIIPIIADVSSQDVYDLFRTANLDYVFHCAAHKHVGLMEINPRSAFDNNTQSTIRLARVCKNCNIKLIFVSTDKAVQPTTVMGATKRIAECWIRVNLDAHTICRFGNVLGSSGSVVEIFEKRIARKLPLVINSPNMSRYFITAAEAVGLVLTSGLLCESGTYTLDMGDPVNIVELADKLAGPYYPKEDSATVSFIEKNEERLFADDETVFGSDMHLALRRILGHSFKNLVSASLEIIENECNVETVNPGLLAKTIVRLAQKL